MRKGVLFGVSVGPGDPELLTLKAVRIIREADVVAVPNSGGKQRMAFDIAQAHLAGKPLLNCQVPMGSDPVSTEAAYRKIADDICMLLDAGKSVAYLTLGDATVYSTYVYVHRLVCERGYDATIVPGVTSFCAAAARLGEPLCEGSESLLVLPASGDADASDAHTTKVFMKAGRQLNVLRDALSERGELEHARMVANCGLPDEQVFPRFAEADMTSGYFSVVIVKGPHEPGWDGR